MEELSLFRSSVNRFKKNASSYIAVGVFCALALILALTISLVDVSLLVITLPLIALPFLFASHVSCYFLEANQPVTLSAFFRYFVGFFNPQFRSSFKGIRAFLISLAIYFGMMIVSYVVMITIFRNQYGTLFSESLTNLIKTYASQETSYDDLMNILNDNDALLLTFFMYVSALPIPFAVLWFIYATSFASISIYYRLNIRGAVASLIRLAINATYSSFGAKMRKDWFKLNWPILVLSILGAVGGALISFLLVKNPLYFQALITIGSVALLVFYLPIYFSNMETLYKRYELAFKDGNKQAIEAVLKRIQSSIELSEEEKRNLEQSFKEENKEEE